MKIVRYEYEKIAGEKIPEWLEDHLVDNFLKQAHGQDYLKDYLNRLKKNNFSTIEEKLEDIRARVGFEISSRLRDEIDKIEKESSNMSSSKSCECNCGGSCGQTLKTASNQELINKVKEILKFISDMARDKPGISSEEILNELKNTNVYSFIKEKVDDEKIRNYAKKQSDKYKLKEEPLRYQTSGSISSTDGESMAEYFMHAKPGGSPS